MTTKLTADWLAATITSDLGITCAKGSAAWERPTIGTSNAYIEWRSDEPQYGTRISKAQDLHATTFAIVIVSTSEIGLWALIDSAKTMTGARPDASIGGSRYKVQWAAWTRAEPSEDTIEALRYAAVAQVTITR